MDSEAKIVRCVQAAAADTGLRSRPAAIRRIIGLGLSEAIATLFPEESPAQRLDLIDRYRVHFLERDDTAMPLFPGVIEGLTGLAERGYLLAVATGKSRRGLDRVLDETGTRELFVPRAALTRRSRNRTRRCSMTFSAPPACSAPDPDGRGHRL